MAPIAASTAACRAALMAQAGMVSGSAASSMLCSRTRSSVGEELAEAEQEALRALPLPAYPPGYGGMATPSSPPAPPPALRQRVAAAEAGGMRSSGSGGGPSTGPKPLLEVRAVSAVLSEAPPLLS